MTSRSDSATRSLRNHRLPLGGLPPLHRNEVDVIKQKVNAFEQTDYTKWKLLRRVICFFERDASRRPVRARNLLAG